MYLKRKEKKRTLMVVASRAVVSRSTFFYNSLASVVGSEKQPWMQWPWDERGKEIKALKKNVVGAVRALDTKIPFHAKKLSYPPKRCPVVHLSLE